MNLIPPGSQPISIRFSMTPTLPNGASKPLGNIFYYLSPNASALSVANAKGQFQGAVAAAWAACLSVKYLAPTIYVRDMTSYANQEIVYLPGVNAAWVGTIALDSLPPSQAFFFGRVTGQRGKNNRGSCRIPMVPESGTSEGDLTDAQLVLAQALGAALTATFTSNGYVFTPQIFSPSLSNLRLGTAGIYMQAITAHVASRTVCGLRRRKQRNIYV
jgi:hypothetical protein